VPRAQPAVVEPLAKVEPVADEREEIVWRLGA
jgi:hypothetical protein